MITVVRRYFSHRRINLFLSMVLIAMSLYIIVWPFLPSFTWWVKFDAPVLSAIAKPNVSREALPEKNTLIIPALGLQEAVFEGESEYTVNQGVWHRPRSSSPLLGGNTVLVGHRFTYNGKSVFYNLDKVRVGDEILLYWDEKPYKYQVESTTVVPPEATEVELPTADPVLTLYTCTPILTAKDRLVVRARLIND